VRLPGQKVSGLTNEVAGLTRDVAGEARAVAGLANEVSGLAWVVAVWQMRLPAWPGTLPGRSGQGGCRHGNEVAGLAREVAGMAMRLLAWPGRLPALPMSFQAWSAGLLYAKFGHEMIAYYTILKVYCLCFTLEIPFLSSFASRLFHLQVDFANKGFELCRVSLLLCLTSLIPIH